MFAHSVAVVSVIAASVGLFAGTVQAQVPTIDLDNTCKAASGVMISLMGGSTTANDLQICKDTENKARDQMNKDWGTYAASDRAGCIQTGVYLPSYVEWLTCFEMNKVVREARQQRAQGVLGGAPGRPSHQHGRLHDAAT